MTEFMFGCVSADRFTFISLPVVFLNYSLGNLKLRTMYSTCIHEICVAIDIRRILFYIRYLSMKYRSGSNFYK